MSSGPITQKSNESANRVFTSLSPVPIIALAGSPNVGKSTLFNALTGAHVTMGNWPGTSVEVSSGSWQLSDDGSQVATLIDLPGAYSLQPISTDEAVTAELLTASTPPDVVIVIVNAAHLVKSLYLVAQLRERPLKVVVALTMNDIASNRGIKIDLNLLSQQLGCSVVLLDPRRRTGLDELKAAVLAQLSVQKVTPRSTFATKSESDESTKSSEADDLAIEDERFAYLEHVISVSTSESERVNTLLSDRIDRWVSGPVSGPFIFLIAMWFVFQLTTTVAAPLQDVLGNFFSGPLSRGATWLLNSVNLGDSWVSGLLVDGLIAGVGMVLSFVPLMSIMFVLLALLEDSGYLARAAVVADRLMRQIGLPGQAFIPLIVGFGCNVPAISATRILPDARQRVLTSLLVPFTSCTARLTVYLLVSSVFFGPWAGTVVFGMYVLSILLVVCTGIILRKTLWRTMGHQPLVLDLPPYQRPTLRLIAAVTWVRLAGFLKLAGGIIVAAVVAVWVLQATPAPGSEASFGAIESADSLYAWLAAGIAPIFAPAGFAAWQVVSALVVGFVAKEAVISSWAQTFAVTDPNVGGTVGVLGDSLRVVFDAASGGHPLPAALAFCTFLLAYSPCAATLAAQRREIGFKWTLFGLVLQLSVAWGLAVVIFQVGRLFA